MSWIDEPGSGTSSGVPSRPPTGTSRSTRSPRRSSSRFRPTMWWVGLGSAVGGAIVAWLLWLIGDSPAGKSDTSGILIEVLGIVMVLVAVVGYGMYQDAAFQSGTGTHEPAWRPTTIARIALAAAFAAGVLHAWRIAEFVARLDLL